MAYGRAILEVFPTAIEAALAQGYLQEAGIPSRLDGVTALAWAGGEMPLTGVGLEVAVEHLERAAQLLAAVSGPMRGVLEPFVDEDELAAAAEAAGPTERLATQGEDPVSAGDLEVEHDDPDDDLDGDPDGEGDDAARAREEELDPTEAARREAVLRTARRGMAAALLAIFGLGFLLALVALSLFADLVPRERWRRLPSKLRWLVGVAALWCLGLAGLGLALLGQGVRWWWLSGWL